MLEKIDKVVSDGLALLERGAKGSRHHCGFDDVWYVDPSLASDITARVELIAKRAMTPEQMVQAARHSKFRSFVEPILSSVARTGSAPQAKPDHATTVEDVSKRHASLFPYMVKSFLKERVSLTGFEKSNGKRMWFAITGKSGGVLNAVGYSGEQKKLPLAKLSQLGFNEINGREDQVISVCRDEIGNIENTDIKKIAFFVGKVAVPGFRVTNAKAKLDNFLSGIPDVKRDISPKQKKNLSAPKIK